MTDTFVWEFPIDGADQWEGFNHPGIEHFRGNAFGSLARETIQNSVDAPSGSPVSVEFQLREIPAADIPDIGQLRAAVQRCASEPTNKSRKAEEFFKTAIKVLGGKSIPVLSISESNTVGMRGPCEIGTPYYAYMKATGQSQKEVTGDVTGLGSYGIGKFAPFAASRVRTMFVSTVFEDKKGKYRQYTQGKTILTSHKDKKGRTKQNIGYWGDRDKCMPVEGGHSVLPKWLQRSPKIAGLQSNRGTTLHIVGFNAMKGWEDVLLASVLKNFFGAIWKGKLVVRVGKDLVAKETIRKLFQQDRLAAALGGIAEEAEAFVNARHYLHVLSESEESIVEEQENRELGNCEIRILVGENLPKRVAILRNGMFITDQMSHLKRFGEYKEFSAVVECLSSKGNELLRDMEPPRHDNFEPERLPTADQPKGQRALSELGRWVREMLRRHAQDPVAEVTDVKELADYFADDAGDDKTGGKGEEVNPLGQIQVRAQPMKRKPMILSEDGPAFDGGSGGGDGDGGGGSGGGSADGSGSGGKGPASGSLAELSNVRSVIVSPRKRRVAFTPTFDGKMQLSVYEAGADTDRRLTIARSSIGKVKQGVVKGIKAKQGSRATIELELGVEFLGAMKVVGHEI